MNPGIYYIYEYENMQKLSTVGFLRIMVHYNTCLLQVSARKLSINPQDMAVISAFQMKNDSISAIKVGEIPCSLRAFSARLPVQESLLPGHSLKRTDGFLIELPGKTLLAAASGIAPDTRKIVRNTPPGELRQDTALDNENPDAPTQETAPDNVIPDTVKEETTPDNVIPDAASEKTTPDNVIPDDASEETTPDNVIPDDASEETTPDNVIPDASSEESTPDNVIPDTVKEETTPDNVIPDAASEETSPNNVIPDAASEETSPDNVIPDDASEETSPDNVIPNAPTQETAPENESSEDSQISSSALLEAESLPCLSVCEKTDDAFCGSCTNFDGSPRKIHRRDLSILPRRFWTLANNSFLLHGYHNYNHLLLIEEDGHYWLGIPGIYDTHEKHAAELFGFSQFTRSYNGQLELSENECCPHGDFGYWCRCLV